MSTVICALAALAAAPAHASSKFLETTGGWTVFSLGRRCSAIDRDAVAFNISPYYALGFDRVVGTRDTVPRLYIWPGALAPDKPVTMSFTLAKGKPITMRAMTMDSFIVTPVDPIAPEDLERVAEPGLLEVRVADVPQSLAFRTDGLKEALESLGRCAAGT